MKELSFKDPKEMPDILNKPLKEVNVSKKKKKKLLKDWLKRTKK